MLTVGSLFSGIGGLDLGLERAGMRVLWQCESNPYCRAVLRKHWPDIPCYEDVKTLLVADPGRSRHTGRHQIEEGGKGTPCSEPASRSLAPASVDVLAGGFPCQPVSLAGRRRGAADERWLWPEFARLIRLLRPRYALMENVPGLLAGGGMAEVLGDLASCGYDAEWDCIPAAAVGAPHLRYRVFILAYPDDAGLEERPGIGGDARQELQAPERDGDALAESGGIGRGEGSRILSRLGSSRRGRWEPEPNVGRVAHGVPSRVDRLRALGNAVVPQVAEYIGRRIAAYEEALSA